MDGMEKIHIPVLLDEVIEALSLRPDGIYVDGTLGLGGHTEAILKGSSPDGRVIGFDWDDNAIALASRRLASFGDRLTIIRRNFAELSAGLASLGISQVDGILIDIGVSSLQIDQGGRGFSFQRDEELDMRMDTRREMTAAKLLAESSEEALADIIYYLGEEIQARPIAAKIVQERRQNPITRSGQLADIVARAIPKRFHPKKIHVATKTFQAIRIAVNSELENLAQIIDTAVPFLKEGASFCIISFHSLEDRIVKNKFKAMQDLEVVTKRPIVAGKEEEMCNPRSRSARLRVAHKREGEGGRDGYQADSR